MTDAIQNYIELKKQYEAIEKRVGDVADLLNFLGNKLRQDPFNFIFSNVAQGLPNGASSRTVSANGSTWPTAPEIQAELARLHESRSQLMQAWAALPADTKSALQPPQIRR